VTTDCRTLRPCVAKAVCKHVPYATWATPLQDICTPLYAHVSPGSSFRFVDKVTLAASMPLSLCAPPSQLRSGQVTLLYVVSLYVSYDKGVLRIVGEYFVLNILRKVWPTPASVAPRKADNIRRRELKLLNTWNTLSKYSTRNAMLKHTNEHTHTQPRVKDFSLSLPVGNLGTSLLQCHCAPCNSPSDTRTGWRIREVCRPRASALGDPHPSAVQQSGSTDHQGSAPSKHLCPSRLNTLARGRQTQASGTCKEPRGPGRGPGRDQRGQTSHH
jgi:hypothetical protein